MHARQRITRSSTLGRTTIDVPYSLTFSLHAWLMGTATRLIKEVVLIMTRSLKHNFDFLFFIKIFIKKVIYLYFNKSIFQDKSIYVVFTFSNSTT